jgi:hypothetical protein
MVLINPHTLKLVETEGTGRKLVQKALGPFEVVERINPQVYRLRLPSSYPMHPVFNAAHLRKYHASSPALGERIILPPTRDINAASPEYEVEAILGHKMTRRKSGNKRMFQIRWAGYGPEDDSWVSEDELRNAPTLKREYLRVSGLPLA